jgi:hypothetical protein
MGTTDEIELVLVPGGATRVLEGQCGALAFNPSSGAAPSCQRSATGRSMRCR